MTSPFAVLSIRKLDLAGHRCTLSIVRDVNPKEHTTLDEASSVKRALVTFLSGVLLASTGCSTPAQGAHEVAASKRPTSGSNLEDSDVRPAKLRLVADFQAFDKQTTKSKIPFPAELTGTFGDKAVRVDEAWLVVRGQSKFQYCTQKPFWLHVKGTTLPLPLATRKSKVASDCGQWIEEAPTSTNNWVRREHLIYEAFQVMLGSERTFRVYPAEITYVQTGTTEPLLRDSYAFFLETPKAFQSRTGAADTNVDEADESKDGEPRQTLKADNLDQGALLAGLIATFLTGGNDLKVGRVGDWHNVKVFAKDGKLPFPVFYDFDGAAPVRGSWYPGCIHGWPYTVDPPGLDTEFETVKQRWITGREKYLAREKEILGANSAPETIRLSTYVEERLNWLESVLKNPARRKRLISESVKVNDSGNDCPEQSPSCY